MLESVWGFSSMVIVGLTLLLYGEVIGFGGSSTFSILAGYSFSFFGGANPNIAKGSLVLLAVSLDTGLFMIGLGAYLTVGYSSLDSVTSSDVMIRVVTVVALLIIITWEGCSFTVSMAGLRMIGDTIGFFVTVDYVVFLVLLSI